MLVGLKTLHRWLALLLVVAHPTPTNVLLARTAVTRGRVCELLGQSRLGRGAQDELFITGLFSLAAPLVGTPLAELLERFPMPEAVVQALLDGSGPYAPYLKLAEASERSDFEEVARYADEIACKPEEIAVVELQSLAWTEQLTAGVSGDVADAAQKPACGGRP